MKSKLKLIIIPILLFSVYESVAKKLDLVCDAASFRIESDRGSLLNPGYIRVVNPAIAAFVSSDGYSTRTTIACDKDDETGATQCLGLNNNEYCKDPKDNFRVRSTKEDNSIIMVANRCMGSYKKYVINHEEIEDIEDPFRASNRMTYYEDRMSFKMKNQIFEDYQNNDQPVLTFDPSSEGSYKLLITPGSWFDMHEQFILETTCKVKK